MRSEGTKCSTTGSDIEARGHTVPNLCLYRRVTLAETKFSPPDVVRLDREPSDGVDTPFLRENADALLDRLDGGDDPFELVLTEGFGHAR